MKIDKSCCIVNVSTGHYIIGQNRLKKSLDEVGYTGSTLFFTDTLPEGAPCHDDSPFGFKPFAIKEAINKGYKKILWLDSNMICIRPPKSIFKKIKTEGHYCWCVYSHKMGEWCSDLALKNLGIDRETALQIYEISPQCLGINADNKTALSFLDEWYHYALDGITFRGIPKEYPLSLTNSNIDELVSKDTRVKGHRHDQTVASFLVWKHDLKHSHYEAKNIQTKTKDGKNIYSKAISVEVEIIQNRDITDEVYLPKVDKWGNKIGFHKVIFIILSIVDFFRRRFLS